MAILETTNEPITVDNINAKKNSGFYIENKLLSAGINELSQGFQFDGLTTRLTAKATIIPYNVYKLTMAIADIGDNIYDSGVFIGLRSFVSSGHKQPLKPDLTQILKKRMDLIDYNNFDWNGDTAKINKSIKFDFNSYEILPDDTLALDELILVFNQFFDTRIKIIGHTDETGTKQYNLDLSLMRAQSVANYLIANGIHPQRILTQGKGKSQPLDKAGTDAASKRNRRVEFLIY